MPTDTGVGPNGVRLVLSLDRAAQNDLDQIARYYKHRLRQTAPASCIVRRALESLKRDLYRLAGNGETKLSREEQSEIVFLAGFRAARPRPMDGAEVFSLASRGTDLTAKGA